MKAARLGVALMAVGVALALPTLAQADTVTDWNQNAEQALLQGGVANAILQSHALSTTQVAVFDAVASVEPFESSTLISVRERPQL